MKAIFREMCPNCGRRIDDERLEHKVPCENCLPQINKDLLEAKSYRDLLLLLERELRKFGTLKNYRKIIQEERELMEFEEFFQKVMGSRLWSAQRTWARRVLQNKSFAILAPTGVGKTVFGIAMALYLATKGKKSYIVLPTTLLVRQVSERARTLAGRAGIDGSTIQAYYTGMSHKKRTEALEAIGKGSYRVLITTSHFLTKNFEKIGSRFFDFIFVDDVDAILKSSKNIDKILTLLGFPQEAVEKALELLYLRQRINYRLLSRKAVPKELEEGYRTASNELGKFLREASPGCLVISTATGRPRGIRIRLFRELLGFDVGSRPELLRNIVDSYKIAENGVMEEAVRLVKMLGRGGLLFLPMGSGEERLKEIVKVLLDNGIRAECVHAGERRGLELFEKGEVDVLVGIATYYGLLVRGLDLPHIVKYAVFLGVPHFRFTAEIEEMSPMRLLQIAMNVRELLPEEDKARIDRLVGRIRGRMMLLDPARIQILLRAFKEGRQLSGLLGRLQEQIMALRDMVRVYLKREDLISELEERTYLRVKIIEGRRYFLLPDAMTYLQASGRTSRMYAGGISKGLSIILVDDLKLFENLTKMVSWYSDEIRWRRLEDIDLKRLIGEIAQERKFIGKIIRGEVRPGEIKDPIKAALLIVESPTKARTIASFFGKPSRRTYAGLRVYEACIGDYVLLIAASKGHIMDLVTEEGYYGVLVSGGKSFYPVYTTIKRCPSCGEQFTEYLDGRKCPRCGSTDVLDQMDTVNSLREISREVDLVLLGTDPDTEGEKIAWDLYLLLSPFVPTIRRIEFHEVTRGAIERALREPRSVDEKLVEAQIVRRIEDRWIGFVLSQKLWRVFGKRWLSAGRVQTPVLGWVIQRLNDARSSMRTIFRITLEDDRVFVAEGVRLDSLRPNKAAAKIKEEGVCISVLERRREEISPPPPFTTDTMLREASTRLGLGVNEVMELAQDLFELGLITYHRTDSPRVSTVGIGIAKDYISRRYGPEFFAPRSWDRAGAHECIRPTRPIDVDTLVSLVRQGILQLARPLTKRHYSLYDLIFRRFVASQMPPSEAMSIRYRLVGPYVEKDYRAYTEIIRNGFTLMWPIPLQEEPAERCFKVVDVRHRKLPTVQLYSQADIIRLMKERTIGRPSTYAKIVERLFERRYVKSTKRGKVIPTKLGMTIYGYLISHYPSLVSEERTRIVEGIMDGVEAGKISYLDALRELYDEILAVDKSG